MYIVIISKCSLTCINAASDAGIIKIVVNPRDEAVIPDVQCARFRVGVVERVIRQSQQLVVLVVVINLP